MAGGRSWRRTGERSRRGSVWPVLAGSVVAFVASEILDDANGDKSATAWVVSAALGLAAFAIVAWFLRDRG
jgi:hypothetical protein